MTTVRAVRDEVKNTLDYLFDVRLAPLVNEVSMSWTRVAWHSAGTEPPFLGSRARPTVEQYVSWATNGVYSAVLLDGSMLQLTYDVEGGEVAGHRLAYVPCPYDIDPELLAAGEPLADVIELYREHEPILRSPVRFDFNPRSAKPGHPAVHLTFNATDCRIACAAPLHPLRFVDFVFRHFYADLWRAHLPFFGPAAWGHYGSSTLAHDEHQSLHLTWDLHTTAGMLGPP